MTTQIDVNHGRGDLHQEGENGLARRSLLQIVCGGAALMAVAPAALAQSGAPRRGGTLTIGADADPIGLDPTTVAAFSSCRNAPAEVRAFFDCLNFFDVCFQFSSP